MYKWKDQNIFFQNFCFCVWSCKREHLEKNDIITSVSTCPLLFCVNMHWGNNDNCRLLDFEDLVGTHLSLVNTASYRVFLFYTFGGRCCFRGVINKKLHSPELKQLSTLHFELWALSYWNNDRMSITLQSWELSNSTSTVLSLRSFLNFHFWDTIKKAANIAVILFVIIWLGVWFFFYWESSALLWATKISFSQWLFSHSTACFWCTLQCYTWTNCTFCFLCFFDHSAYFINISIYHSLIRSLGKKAE